MDDHAHADRAIRALAAEDWQRAGDQYTPAAYGTLAGHEGFRREAVLCLRCNSVVEERV